MKVFRLILAVSLLLSTSGSLGLTQTDPNHTEKKPGWSAWQPLERLASQPIASGFSNSELGGFLDFKAACAEASGQPEAKLPIWFRVSDLVQQIGTGQIEFGCWNGGQFRFTMLNTAIQTDRENVNCLRVNADVRGGLVLRAEASTKARAIDIIANGRTVDPGSHPALLSYEDNRAWLLIQKPRQGWVSTGVAGQPANLRHCQL